MHKYLQYKPGNLAGKNYQYKIPLKYPITQEKAKLLDIISGKISYFHSFANDPNQINYGHKLYRHIKLGFCTSKPVSEQNSQLNEVQQPEIKQKKYQINNVNVIANIYGENQAISYTIDQEIKGNKGNQEEGLYILAYTCKVCETKQARSFTKNAYHNGVVLIRCEGCEKQHLIADNLGWFEDDPVNVEILMKRQGNSVAKISAIQKEDIKKIIDEF